MAILHGLRAVAGAGVGGAEGVQVAGVLSSWGSRVCWRWRIASELPLLEQEASTWKVGEAKVGPALEGGAEVAEGLVAAAFALDRKPSCL